MDSVQAAARPTRIDFSATLLFDLAALALVALGNLLLAARVDAPLFAFLLIGSGIVLRIAQLRLEFFAIPLQLPWLLFIASAWIGVTVSFDPAAALRKFELILGGIALYYVIASTRSDVSKKLIVWGTVLIGAGVALFYVTQTDFTQEPIKVELLNRIGLAIHRFSPQFGFHTPHANLMAGIMLLCLPFAVGLAYEGWRKKEWFGVTAAGAGALLLAICLVMTGSRGALLALVVLALVSAYLWGASMVAKRMGVSTGLGIAIAFNLLLVLVLLGLVVGGSGLRQSLIYATGTVGGVPRVILYQQVSQLAQDYTFTGAGLDTFSPQYSTYELVINVPLLPHGHNLFLQVWYEQGILGIVAFFWLLVAYYIWVFRRRARFNWLAAAGLAATTLMLLHGLTDVLFYFSRVIALMFISIGLTVAALDPFAPLPVQQGENSRRLRLAGAAAAVLFILVLGAFALLRREQLTAAWLANLGALEQARLELPQIAFPQPTPAQVRRTTDLAKPITLYQQALAHDPQNRVAHSRLGLIALDNFDFEQAVKHLEAAYRADKSNRAVLKTLGLAYVWTGRLDEAEPLFEHIDEARVELGYSLNEWDKRDRADLTAFTRQMIARLKQ